jgi:hypothetical protein
MGILWAPAALIDLPVDARTKTISRAQSSGVSSKCRRHRIGVGGRREDQWSAAHHGLRSRAFVGGPKPEELEGDN